MELLKHRKSIAVLFSTLISAFVFPSAVEAAPSHPPTPALAQPATSQQPCALVPPIVAQVSAIRGLTAKSKVPCKVKNRTEVEASLRKLVKVKVPEQRLATEALIYKTIGFIPKDFDYEQGLLDLYVSQLGGYYNPVERYFVMASWIPAALQTPVAAHELVHALQDQYYELADFTSPEKFSSDELLARSALLEGDATAVMLDFARKAAGQPSLAQESNIAGILLQNLAGGGLSASLRSVPQSLQLTLFFPYTSGLRFAHDLLRKGGYAAIDKAFKNPPRSTAEILHPELYQSESFAPYSFNESVLANGCSILHRETLGEFLISALLSQYSANKSTVSAAAAGWKGDRLLLLECAGRQASPAQKGSHRELVWQIAWNSKADREEFKALFNPLGATLSVSESAGEPQSALISARWTL